MLWYKAWRETRNVIAVGVGAMALACLLIVYYEQAMRASADEPLSYIAYIYKGVYNSLGRDMFVILAVILGSGGLVHEKALGTAGFTLSLPASRLRIGLWRAAMGYLGVLAIALMPVLTVPVASRFAGEAYPVQQTLGFFWLWAGCGAVFYGYTFLLAQLVEGEFAPFLLAITSLMLYGVAAELPWLARFPMLNVFDIMNGDGMPFFDGHLRLLVGSLPWVTLCAMGVIAVLLVYGGARRMEPRDF